VLLVTGFLGSGKTTLIRRILGDPRFSDSMVIVNEFGEVGIDHHLLEQADDRTVLLASGCMCCELRGDLQETLVDLAMRRRQATVPSFSRIIVETSGLADPGPIVQTLFNDPALAKDYRISHVVALVDASDHRVRLASPTIAQHQVAAADVLVLSKADIADAASMARTKTWATSISASATCTAAANAAVDADLLLDDRELGWIEALREADPSAPGHSHDEHSHDIASFVLRLRPPVARQTFEAFLENLVRLRGDDLLRVKGFVRFEGEQTPVIVQGVGRVFDAFRPFHGALDASTESTIVIIAHALEAAQVRNLWLALHALSAPERR
jgi:G3E family GTPase